MRRTTVVLLALACAACGHPRVWRGLSPDHRTDFQIFSSDGRTCVQIGIEPRACYDAVALRDITFSQDSRSVAFPAREGNEWFVVHDGRPGAAAQGIGGIVLSADGARLAYAALRGGAWHVVVDGAYSEPFNAVFSGSLTFDRSGRRVAFAAERDGRAAAVIDGSIGHGHDGIGHITFSPDGRHVGYVARDGATARLILDGTPGPEHDAISEFEFAPSGSATAYLARDRDGWFMIRSDTRVGPYATARALSYAPGGNVTFVAGDGTTERVVVNGRPGRAFESVEAPAFARSGDAWGYIGHDSAASTVILNGEELDAREWASDLAIAADGSRYAYVARRKGAASVVHDRGEASFDLVVDGTLVLTRGGAWSCLVGDWDQRKLYVVVEGHLGRREFQWVQFANVAQGQVAGGTAQGLSAEALRAWVAAEAELITTRRP